MRSDRCSSLKKGLSFFAVLIFLFSLCSLTVSASSSIQEKDCKGCKASQFSECERVVSVNGKKLKLDPISTQKGDGIRSVLEKDPFALKLLDEYQGSSHSNIVPYVLGTPGLLLMGWRLGAQENLGRDTLFWSGVGLLVGGYVWGRVSEAVNESKLKKAIRHYNAEAEKKNYPLIEENY